MATLTLTFPPGTCAEVSRTGGNWIVNSVNTTDVVITVEDADNDGLISNAEWDLAVSGDGNDIGDAGFLFEGGGNSGFLYASNGVTTFTVGDDVSNIRDNMSNTFEADVSSVVCFAKGTLIATAQGSKPIEALVVGDEIMTSKGKLRPIRWIGRRRVSEFEMRHAPKLLPVRIRAGTLGKQIPLRDLVVSRQHRVLLRSKIAERMFGSCEVLVPAIKLTGVPGIDVDHRVKSIEYFHILLDEHEILLAEGAPAESLFTGSQALNALSGDAIEEISTLFPEIVEYMADHGTTAPVPSGSKIRKMLQRHKKNGKELIGS